MIAACNVKMAQYVMPTVGEGSEGGGGLGENWYFLELHAMSNIFLLCFCRQCYYSLPTCINGRRNWLLDLLPINVKILL